MVRLQNNIFIDPESCGSSIGYYITVKLEKIDAALGMLQEFRKKYIETEKLIAKLNK